MIFVKGNKSVEDLGYRKSTCTKCYFVIFGIFNFPPSICLLSKILLKTVFFKMNFQTSSKFEYAIDFQDLTILVS